MGVRRTLLLSRAINATAIKDYTDWLKMTRTTALAMRGPRCTNHRMHEFKSETSSDVVRASALLAGCLAVLFSSKQRQDSIRKADDFSGTFLESHETVPSSG